LCLKNAGTYIAIQENTYEGAPVPPRKKCASIDSKFPLLKWGRFTTIVRSLRNWMSLQVDHLR
jgi:hypothetical protein